MKSKVETSLAAEKKKKKELRHEKLRQIISSSIPLKALITKTLKI